MPDKTVWQYIVSFLALTSISWLKWTLLKKPLSLFNPDKQLFLCLQHWFGEITHPQINRCIFYYQLETNNFIEKNKIPFIPFFWILLNLYCFCISLGVHYKLGIGHVQYSFIQRVINYRLLDNKDTEWVTSIKLYELCVLRRRSKEEWVSSIAIVLGAWKAWKCFWYSNNSFVGQ